jgi:hypothetical protein
VALIVVDVVTSRRHNLHEELMTFLDLPAELQEAAATRLYAVAYRLHLRDDDKRELQLWPEALTVDEELPTLPLWLSEELAVPLNLEESYQAAGETLRLE